MHVKAMLIISFVNSGILGRKRTLKFRERLICPNVNFLIIHVKDKQSETTVSELAFIICV